MLFVFSGAFSQLDEKLKEAARFIEVSSARWVKSPEIVSKTLVSAGWARSSRPDLELRVC